MVLGGESKMFQFGPKHYLLHTSQCQKLLVTLGYLEVALMTRFLSTLRNSFLYLSKVYYMPTIN